MTVFHFTSHSNIIQTFKFNKYSLVRKYMFYWSLSENNHKLAEKYDIFS